MKYVQTYALLLIAVVLALIIPERLYGYSDEVTHPALTQGAIKNSTTDNRLINLIGLINGVDKTYLSATLWNGEKNETATKTILDWLKYGSQMEDTPSCRAGNHFFDPLKEWSEAGLTDFNVSWLSEVVIKGYCDYGKSWPVGDIRSNLTWATRFTAPGVKEDFTGRPLERQPFTWDTAREAGDYNLLLLNAKPGGNGGGQFRGLFFPDVSRVLALGAGVSTFFIPPVEETL